MRKKRKSEYERFMALSDVQKDREVSKYDSPEAIPTKPLRAKDKALHRKAGRRAGRPKIGEDAKIVPVSIEGELLRLADAFARTSVEEVGDGGPRITPGHDGRINGSRRNERPQSIFMKPGAFPVSCPDSAPNDRGCHRFHF